MAASAAATDHAARLDDHAARLDEVCGNDMRIFHDLCRGGVEQISLLFSEIAGSPLPPAVILQVLSITEAQLQQAQTLQAPPTASLLQFQEAMAAAVEEAADVPQFRVLLQKHIGRLQHAASVLDAVTSQLAKLHAETGGSITAIERLLMDLAPPGQKGRPMPNGMINALLRVPRDATACTLDDVVACFWRNLDPSDTVAEISAVLEEHMKK
jgi:hypothetical protein